METCKIELSLRGSRLRPEKNRRTTHDGRRLAPMQDALAFGVERDASAELA